MAKAIEFKGNGLSFSASIEKVDREKVYGWTQTKVFDSQGKECKVANLLEDGRTLLPSGCFSLKILTESGNETSRSSLIAVDPQGKKMELIPSVFDQPVDLQDATIDEYLSMNVKVVYQLEIGAEKDALTARLKTGNLLRFKYNYRAGYESDDAFILCNDQAVFMVVGKCLSFEMLDLTSEVPAEEPEIAVEDDALDFSML
jgi:hypothetical protein